MAAVVSPQIKISGSQLSRSTFTLGSVGAEISPTVKPASNSPTTETTTNTITNTVLSSTSLTVATTTTATTSDARINPSFRLKKVDVYDVLEKYNNGEFDNILPEAGTNVTKATKITLTKQYGDSPDDQVYLHPEGSLKTKVVTINHPLYISCRNGTILSDVKCQDCHWCRHSVSNAGIGIPIKKTIQSDGITRYDTIGFYCTYNCAYADLLRLLDRPRSRIPSYLANSLCMLFTLYRQQYPNEPKILKPTQPWQFSDRFGGPLTESEYRANTYRYIPMTHVHMLPSKTLYMRS